jgi:colicin import membrane protein
MSTGFAKPAGYGPSSAADPNEGKRFGPAFWVSAGLHGLALGLLVVLTFALKDKIEAQPAVFELVAGEGDDFMATEAPSGHEAGQAKDGPIEFTAPESVPEWTPPAPAPVEVTPVEPVAPAPVEPVKKAEPVKPPVAEPKTNFTQNIKSAIRKETRKAEREVKAQRAADAKAAAEEAKRTSYEQFQKQNASKTKSTSKSSGVANATPGPRIDASGIKKGVTGGTGAGSTGAGGTALARAEANAMDAYFSMLRARLLSSHELPGGVSDLLSAEVQFTFAANGAVSGVRIVRSSGSKDFDDSVLEAFGRLKMPARPDKKTDVQRLTFRIKEA